MAETFDAFRAAHASVSDAIAKCTRPDWLARLAVEAMPDRKEALQVAVKAAWWLTRRPYLMRLLRPRPDPLEPLEIYTGYPSFEDKRLFNRGRAVMLGLVTAAILNVVIYTVVWHPQNELAIWLVQLATIVALTVPFAVLIFAMFTTVVRRQVARLDDDSALEKLASIIERSAAKNPLKRAQVISDVRTAIER